ncbi:MAG: DUF1611 domain-containing protein [Gemmatimonadota bacterium]|nr:DUF1611 domain-containing protein [Gemmatimonadota bacterium]
MQPRRMVILTEGQLGTFSSKTAASLVRYKSDETVAVLDSVHAGKKLEDVLEVGTGIPIVATLQEAMAFEPTSLVIGIATPGGVLPDAWRETIHEAIEHGLEVVNGLHTFLNEDEEFARHAGRKGVRLWDVRQPPGDLDVGRHQVHGLPNLRVLTVGTDSSIGKKIAAIEIDRAARSASRRGAAGPGTVPPAGQGRDAQPTRGRAVLRGDDYRPRDHCPVPVPLPGRRRIAQLLRNVSGRCRAGSGPGRRGDRTSGDGLREIRLRSHT